jgi:hypothetical protein
MKLVTKRGEIRSMGNLPTYIQQSTKQVNNAKR